MTKARPRTEAQWLASQAPYEMLRHLQQHCTVTRAPGGRRRLKLFCCACCRQVWHLFGDERSRQAVEVAERFCDGRARKDELTAAWRAAQAAARQAANAFQAPPHPQPGSPEFAARLRAQSTASAAEWTACSTCAVQAAQIVSMTLENAHRVAVDPTWVGMPVQPALAVTQAGFLRDLFTPFRSPPAPDPAWLRWDGGTVAQMAQTIHADRAFERLPVLADALEEAGCADAALLGHLRGPGPHVRGCWAVDLLRQGKAET